MRRLPLYIFDLDGTLYRGSQPVDHAPEVVRQLHDEGASVRYVTNNSAARPEETSKKLVDMGYPSEPGWVYGSGPAAARYVLSLGFHTVFVVGEPSLEETCRATGLHTVTSDEALAGQVEAVVAGICRSFNYSLLRAAMRAVRHGAAFVATNLDSTYPVEEGLFDPGAGSIVASIATASGVRPDVVGKPAPLMILDILRDTNVLASDALVVGDRMDTDIAAGKAAGCPTFLVLTGVASDIPLGEDGADDLRGLL